MIINIYLKILKNTYNTLYYFSGSPARLRSLLTAVMLSERSKEEF